MRIVPRCAAGSLVGNASVVAQIAPRKTKRRRFMGFLPPIGSVEMPLPQNRINPSDFVKARIGMRNAGKPRMQFPDFAEPVLGGREAPTEGSIRATLCQVR
jgi:hypothetical protein